MDSDSSSLSSGSDSAVAMRRPEARRTRYALIIYVLLLLAGTLRFADIGGKSMWVDEAKGLYDNCGPIDGINFRCRFGYTPPLREYLLHYASQGPSDILEAASRMPSALAGTLMAPMVFALGSLLFGRRAGVCAAVFLLAHPWHVLHSQDSRMHVVFLFFSTLMLYQLCRIIFRRDTLMRWAVLGAIAATFAYFSYLAALSFAGLAIIAFWDLLAIAMHKTRRNRLRARLTGMGLAILVFLALYYPWISTAFNTFNRQRVDKIRTKETPMTPATMKALGIPGPPDAAASETAQPAAPPPEPRPHLTTFDCGYFKGLLSDMGGNSSVGMALAGALGAIGFLSLLRRKLRSRLILPIAWIAAPMPIFIIASGPIFFPQRYLMMYLPMLALMVGCGAAYLSGVIVRKTPITAMRRWRPAWLAAAIMAPLAVTSVMGLCSYYPAEKQNWRGAMALIEEHINYGGTLIAGDHWTIYGIIPYQDRALGKPYSVVADALSLGDLQRALEAPGDVWYLYWSPLPDYIEQLLRTKMVEVARYPGLEGDVRVLRRR